MGESMGYKAECARQVEFLKILAGLLDDYEAQIGVCSDRDGDNTIELDACGTWIHGLQEIRRLDAEACRKAQREALTYAESLGEEFS
jgi:hypothetical protein